MKKYIVKIEEKAEGIISEFQQKNKALSYELKKSKDMQETQKICEDVLRDAQDGMIVKHAQQNEEIKKQNEQIKKQNEQIKNMKNEIGKKRYSNNFIVNTGWLFVNYIWSSFVFTKNLCQFNKNNNILTLGKKTCEAI